MTTTLKQLAPLVKVSPATVSEALSGLRGAIGETQRIVVLVQRLDYQPSGLGHVPFNVASANACDCIHTNNENRFFLAFRFHTREK